jgi:hypothetical protein
MMISAEQRDVVITALARHLGDNQPFYSFVAAEIRSFLADETGREYERVIYAEAWPTNPLDAAGKMLQLLQLRTPPGPQPDLLSRYLERLAREGFPVLGEIVVQLQAELQAAGNGRPGHGRDAFDTFHILGRRPFLDRRPLRPKLRSLLFVADGPSVLAVSGPPGSGKSYTTALLEHLRRQLRDFEMSGPVDLEGEALPPREVARRLVARMMYRPTNSMPDHGLETPNSYLIRLAEWVIGEAVATGKRWCLIIDGANRDALLPDTRTLIQLLAAEIQNGVARDHLRLILLDYQEPFTNLWPGTFDREPLDPPDTIGQVDVEDYFAGLTESMCQPVDRDAVRSAAETVMAQCPVGVAERMRLINQATDDAGTVFLQWLRGRA